MKQIILNGQQQHTEQTTVLALLEGLAMAKGRFAVEIDGMLVPKTQLAHTLLVEGMRIEVVQAVGGG